MRRCVSSYTPPHIFGAILKPPKCRICGEEHFGAAHVWKKEPPKPSELCATNAATNRKNATNNAPRDKPPVDVSDAGGVQGEVGKAAGKEVGKANGGRTKNRRAKEAYNAYQREYMAKRRAKAKLNA